MGSEKQGESLVLFGDGGGGIDGMVSAETKNAPWQHVVTKARFNLLSERC